MNRFSQRLLALLFLAPLAAADTTLYETKFDDAQGWQLDPCWNVDGTPNVLGGIAKSFPASLNCNNPDGSYSGCLDRWAISPVVDIGPVTWGAMATFWCKWITENDCVSDAKHLYVLDANTGQVLLEQCMSLQTGCPVSEWHEHIVPLDPAWGEIRVAFRFDVHDDLLNYVGGWMVDDLVVLGNCLGSTPYCTAKLNSQGCTPSIFTTGAPSYFGSSTPFLVHAQQVLNQHPGMAIWSLTQASNPLAGGTLCVGGPLVRTPGQGSGGNAGPPDCSGTYVYQFTKPYMQAQSLVPGKTVHVQFWSRDTGFAEPDNVGLTAGVSFTICN